MKTWLISIPLFILALLLCGAAHADNMAVTAGSGSTIAADDIGGVLYQRLKMTWGADNTANDVSAANPLPATILSVTPGTGATALGKAEDAPAVTGDTLIGTAGVINLTLTTPAADGDYTSPTLGRYGQTLITPILDSSLIAGTASALRSEDVAASSGDTVTPMGAVVNNTGSSTVNADGDYANIAVNLKGATKIDIDQAFQRSSTDGFLIAEDAAENVDGQALAKIGARRQDTLSTTTSADGDASDIKVDSGGRLYVNAFGADLANQGWKACSTTVTNTSDASIKAFVASNYLYITGYVCTNDSGTGSRIAFKSNTSQIWQDYVGPNTLSNNIARFTPSTPLRTAVGEAFQFAMATTGTSTICCAVGFYSTN